MCVTTLLIHIPVHISRPSKRQFHMSRVIGVLWRCTFQITGPHEQTHGYYVLDIPVMIPKLAVHDVGDCPIHLQKKEGATSKTEFELD